MLVTLLKKEFFESIKTKKFLVLPIVMIFFATSSPFLAYYMREIFASLGGEELSDMLDAIPAPKMMDSFGQLLDNFNQLVYFVLIFLATTIFISDKTKGRLSLLLSKPIKCYQLMASKFISITIQFIVSYLISSYFFIAATQILFDEFDYLIFLQISSLFIFYGIFLITLSLFSSVVFKSYMGSVLTTVAVFLVSGIFAPLLQADILFIIPGYVVNLEAQILQNNVDTMNFIINLSSTFIISVILFIASVEIFKRQEIE